MFSKSANAGANPKKGIVSCPPATNATKCRRRELHYLTGALDAGGEAVIDPESEAIVPVSYNIGTGIGEVTDPAVGLPLQGMADETQIATGVESPLYARAFVVAQPPPAAAGGCVVIIVADIWAGTRRVKDGVLTRLAATHEGLYTESNVLLAGTHTHSAPGGFSGALLYDFDFDRGGCDEATVTCIVDGCVKAVEMADANLAPGRIYVNRGEVADCGRNRSRPAYLCNPRAERDRWDADTDREMLLLKFVKVDNGGQERAVGALSWYAIHPTDRGQKNTLVSGDNKGYASSLFEQRMSSDHRKPETFVAAFANANCGDVSGNVELGHIPDGVHDIAQMQKHGRQQFEVAERLFSAATEEVTGPVDHRQKRARGRRHSESRSRQAAQRTASRCPTSGYAKASRPPTSMRETP
jgi:neutral ceramidase